MKILFHSNSKINMRYWAFLLSLILMVLFNTSVYAQQPSNFELFTLGYNAYRNTNYLDAIIYLTAYVERDPELMSSNERHAKQVEDALAFARSRVSQYKEVPGLRADLRTCEQNSQQARSSTGSISSGLGSSPPSLDLPSTDTPPSYPLVCRGGGPMLFTYAAQSNLSSQPQVWIEFARANINAGFNWENVRHLEPGQCTWLDRRVAADEPNRIVLRDPTVSPNEFAISWSADVVNTIASSGTARDNTNTQSIPVLGFEMPVLEFLAVAANQPSDLASVVRGLQSNLWLQTFNVYNDRNGNFIATATGKSENFGKYAPLYAVTDVATNDHLNLRSEAGAWSSIVIQIPYDGQNIEITDPGTISENVLWLPVRYELFNGWVNSRYLTQQGEIIDENLVELIRQLYVASPYMTGLDVRMVQQALLNRGYSELGPVDGTYGPQTESAVKRFQQDNGLTVDGVVGPQTWVALNR